jgi:hypothetical protein
VALPESAVKAANAAMLGLIGGAPYNKVGRQAAGGGVGAGQPPLVTSAVTSMTSVATSVL